MPRSHHHTQWAGTFAIGAQLSRRGNSVSITLGNTPACDLLCISPSEVPFKVEVKSTNSANFIRIQKALLERPIDPSLFVIVVLLPDDLDQPEQFFILTHAETCNAWNAIPKLKRNGEAPVAGHEGINWKAVKEHHARWDKLPA